MGLWAYKAGIFITEIHGVIQTRLFWAYHAGGLINRGLNKRGLLYCNYLFHMNFICCITPPFCKQILSTR